MTPNRRPQPGQSSEFEQHIRASLQDPVARLLRHPWILELEAYAEPLSELDYCELLIEYANEGTLPHDKWLALLCGSTPHTDPAVGKRWAAPTIGPACVDIVRDQLGQLVKLGPRRVQPALGSDWAKNARHRLMLLPAFESDAGKMRVSYRLLSKDRWAVICYVMVLFLDANRPFGRNLCRCKECGRFFFVRTRGKSGRPRRDYCSEGHSREAYSRQLRERAAASRAGLSVAAWRRRKHK